MEMPESKTVRVVELSRQVIDRFAWELEEWRVPSRPAFIQEELDHVVMDHIVWRPGERVLDIGCGPGTYMRSLADRGACPVGVDIAQLLLRLAHRGGHRVAAADGHFLPFADAAFDALLCHRTLYLLSRPEQAIREFARVLRPGGRVVFSTSNLASPYARTQTLTLLGSRNHAWARSNSWSVSRWCRGFKACGLVTRAIYSCNLVWPLVFRVCDRWIIPNEWMRRYNHWVRRISGVPLRTPHALGAAMDYVVEVVKTTSATVPECVDQAVQPSRRDFEANLAEGLRESRRSSTAVAPALDRVRDRQPSRRQR
jgi:SAM-dependent methyltransferase